MGIKRYDREKSWQDKDQVNLKFNVNGDFTQKEQKEIQDFITTEILGKRVDFVDLMEQFCKERNYIFMFGGETLSIYK